jgi:hypothetical protein
VTEYAVGLAAGVMFVVVAGAVLCALAEPPPRRE